MYCVVLFLHTLVPVRTVKTEFQLSFVSRKQKICFYISFKALHNNYWEFWKTETQYFKIRNCHKVCHKSKLQKHICYLQCWYWKHHTKEWRYCLDDCLPLKIIYRPLDVCWLFWSLGLLFYQLLPKIMFLFHLVYQNLYLKDLDVKNPSMLL